MTFSRNWLYLLCLAFNSIFPLFANAQIIPDDSLGNETTKVTNLQNNIEHISGGATRGNNLFHSFLEFSIAEGASVYFASPEGIANILTRVTGNNPSEILGTLRVLGSGNTNLFLINPNGIMFGPNANLAISGSFVASTASSIVLADGSEFSAINPQTPPLLTVTATAPVGLRFAGRPGIITSEAQLKFLGQTIALIGGDVSLEGGSITAEGGRVEIGSVQDNTIVNLVPNELGWKFNYEQVNNFGDINLSNGTLVKTSEEATGDIHFQGRRIILREQSQLSSQPFSGNGGHISVNASDLIKLTGGAEIETNTIGENTGGNIHLQASESIIIRGEGEVKPAIISKTSASAQGNAGRITIETANLTISNGAAINSDTTGQGNSGNINIQSQQITITNNGANISSFTNGNGRGGNVTIQASESIEIRGEGNNNSAISTQAFGEGDAGKITIETAKMVITEAGFISASTFNSGNAGDIEIIASQSIELSNQNSLSEEAGGIRSQTAKYYSEAIGNAGDITITTANLTISGGMQISSASRNNSQAGTITITVADSILLSGTAPDATLERGQSGIFVSAEPAQPDLNIPPGGATGDLLIETRQLTLEEGATISGSTLGEDKGGDITLNVHRLIVRQGGLISTGSLIGENPLDSERGNGGSLNINASESVEVSDSGTVVNIPIDSELRSASESTGNAGNITINTPELIVSHGGAINVDSSGTGEGGDISVNSENVTLNQGTISAESTSGKGGNIIMSVNDTLELRQGSQISTTAGNQQTGGDGGNITLNPARFIVARPEENSDIRADAFTGDGGRIEITTEGIFGIEARNQPTDFSDITASSEFGVDGEITINQITTDPTTKVDNIPRPTENIEFIKACSSGRRGKIELFNLGRGGLPIQPEDPLQGTTIIAPWIPLNVANQTPTTTTQWNKPSPSPTTPYTILTTCRVR